MDASRSWSTSRFGFKPRRQVVLQPWALVSVVSNVSVWKATPPAAGPWPLDPRGRPAAVSLSTLSQTETIETTETKLTEIGTTFVSVSSRRLGFRPHSWVPAVCASNAETMRAPTRPAFRPPRPGVWIDKRNVAHLLPCQEAPDAEMIRELALRADESSAGPTRD